VLLSKSPKETLLGTWGTHWDYDWEVMGTSKFEKIKPHNTPLTLMGACLNHLIGCMKILSLRLLVILFDLGYHPSSTFH
jgi:hypothetical protein